MQLFGFVVDVCLFQFCYQLCMQCGLCDVIDYCFGQLLLFGQQVCLCVRQVQVGYVDCMVFVVQQWQELLLCVGQGIGEMFIGLVVVQCLVGGCQVGIVRLVVVIGGGIGVDLQLCWYVQGLFQCMLVCLCYFVVVGCIGQLMVQLLVCMCMVVGCMQCNYLYVQV